APAQPKPAPRSEPRPPRPKAPPPPPAPHPADAQLAQLAYVIVNEAGASVYSTSPVGREEFPEFDAPLRSGISIGRRLQRPPSPDRAKSDPKNTGAAFHHHAHNPNSPRGPREWATQSCANSVGGAPNPASAPLLRHVSGLNQLTARRLVEPRKAKGPFSNRQQ